MDLNYLRRFGAEIEINSFDMRNRPIGYEEGKLPVGIHYVGDLVKSTLSESVLIHKWGNDHNNDCWVVKPDASCGMEVCTPVLKGWQGLMKVCRVVDKFKEDPKINADERCSFHLHVEVSDLSVEQIASVITWWIKCEAVFMDSVPVSRKRNQYCQLLGQTDLFENIEKGLFSCDSLIKKVGRSKYYSINTYHYFNRRRNTIEFRIMDSECCSNSWMAKNWIRLILHFVETAVKRGLPKDYEFKDKWSGYCWLDPEDVFDFLGFRNNDLSPGLEQVRKWFLTRLFYKGRYTGVQGVMSDKARRIAIQQVDSLISEIIPDFFENNFIASSEDVYSDKFRI